MSISGSKAVVDDFSGSGVVALAASSNRGPEQLRPRNDLDAQVPLELYVCTDFVKGTKSAPCSTASMIHAPSS